MSPWSKSMREGDMAWVLAIDLVAYTINLLKFSGCML